MRIVVLSDTHMPRRGRRLPDSILAELRRADLIFHLGDFTGIEVVHNLQDYSPVQGVHGNNDREENVALFPVTQRLVLHGHTIRLLHGQVCSLETATSAWYADHRGDL